MRQARPFFPLFAAIALSLAGFYALDTAARSVAMAQARNPLTGRTPEIRPAPGWSNQSWLNTPNDEPLSLASLKGRVVLLNFWTFTCWNCTGAVPSLVDYDRKYRDRGLTIIGIHTPEF